METYELLRSKRRTLALEVTREGRVLVRAPLRCSQSQIQSFVDQHRPWLERHLAAVRERLKTAPPPPTPADIAALKALARAVLPEKTARYAAAMGLHPTGVKITAARKRYGSCSAKNGLCFSCFLMRSPDAAVDAVVVHELAHIVHKNHGPEFYALVERYLPDYQARKKLLG